MRRWIIEGWYPDQSYTIVLKSSIHILYSCLLCFFFPFNVRSKFWRENLRGSEEAHCQPHDCFCNTFGLHPRMERRTTAVLLFSQHRWELRSWSGCEALHQFLPLAISLSPLLSLSAPPSHFLIFTTQWFKYLSSYFSFCFTLSLSSLWPISPPSSSVLLIYISLSFSSFFFHFYFSTSSVTSQSHLLSQNWQKAHWRKLTG